MKGGLLSTTAKPNLEAVSIWEGSSAKGFTTPSATEEKGPAKPNVERIKNGGGKSHPEAARPSEKDFKSIFDFGLLTLVSGAFLLGVGITATGGALCFLCRRSKNKNVAKKLVEQTSKDLVEVKKSLSDNQRETATQLNSLRMDNLESRRDVKREIRESSRMIEGKLEKATIEHERETELSMMNSSKSIVKKRGASDRRMGHKIMMEKESWEKAGGNENAGGRRYTSHSSFHPSSPTDYQVGGAVPDAERVGVEPEAFEERRGLLEEYEEKNE